MSVFSRIIGNRLQTGRLEVVDIASEQELRAYIQRGHIKCIYNAMDRTKCTGSF